MKNNLLTKMTEFEGQKLEIIIEKNELLFELYSTGMALGYVKTAKGKKYPQKDRVDKILKNAEISTVVHGIQQYLTEDMLYDFMLESRTDKCNVGVVKTNAYKSWIRYFPREEIPSKEDYEIWEGIDFSKPISLCILETLIRLQ